MQQRGALVSQAPPEAIGIEALVGDNSAASGAGPRAWSLYGELCRQDVLATALAAVVRNAGAPGVDGVTTETVDNRCGPGGRLPHRVANAAAREKLRPSPVLRAWIAKADGKQRPLGIPTVKDRVVQTALQLLLEPIFEADFHEASYGYRPGKNAHQAMEAISQSLLRGKTEVIDADLSDGSILELVKRFLKAPIVEEKSGQRSIHPNDRGTLQGGVISPLLANLYLNSLATA